MTHIYYVHILHKNGHKYEERNETGGNNDGPSFVRKVQEKVY